MKRDDAQKKKPLLQKSAFSFLVAEEITLLILSIEVYHRQRDEAR
jgi:hypothetical protein